MHRHDICISVCDAEAVPNIGLCRVTGHALCYCMSIYVVNRSYLRRCACCVTGVSVGEVLSV